MLLVVSWGSCGIGPVWLGVLVLIAFCDWFGFGAWGSRLCGSCVCLCVGGFVCRCLHFGALGRVAVGVRRGC